MASVVKRGNHDRTSSLLKPPWDQPRPSGSPVRAGSRSQSRYRAFRRPAVLRLPCRAPKANIRFAQLRQAARRARGGWLRSPPTEQNAGHSGGRRRATKAEHRSNGSARSPCLSSYSARIRAAESCEAVVHRVRLAADRRRQTDFDHEYQTSTRRWHGPLSPAFPANPYLDLAEDRLTITPLGSREPLTTFHR